MKGTASPRIAPATPGGRHIPSSVLSDGWNPPRVAMLNSERLQQDPRRGNYLKTKEDKVSRKGCDPMLTLDAVRGNEHTSRLVLQANRRRLQATKLELSKRHMVEARLDGAAAYKADLQKERIALQNVEPAHDDDVLRLRRVASSIPNLNPSPGPDPGPGSNPGPTTNRGPGFNLDPGPNPDPQPQPPPKYYGTARCLHPPQAKPKHTHTKHTHTSPSRPFTRATTPATTRCHHPHSELLNRRLATYERDPSRRSWWKFFMLMDKDKCAARRAPRAPRAPRALRATRRPTRPARPSPPRAPRTPRAPRAPPALPLSRHARSASLAAGRASWRTAPSSSLSARS